MLTDPTRGRSGGVEASLGSIKPDESGPVSDTVQPACASALHQGPPPIPALPNLPDTDEDLFALYADTDSDRALREIVIRYEPKILRYFLRNSATRSRAEDLTQEVFIRIIRNRSSYDRTRKFSTWSKTIAERIAINASRGNQRSRVVSMSDLPTDPESDREWLLDPLDPSPLPDEIVESRERRAMLEEALGQVEERYRLPAMLHFLEGLPHSEAAGRLGIPVGTAKSRTHHAIEDLRTLLRGRDLIPI